MDQTTDLLASMSDSVYQTLVETHQQHPDWFQNKFKSYSWQNAEFKDKFITRLVEKFTPTEDPDTVILKVIALLTHIFLPVFFKSQQFIRLIGKLRPQVLSDEGLTVLLLDSENVSLDIKMEKLLERLSSYPLKIKLAVANWRVLGKKDEELKERGYDLIHVPGGKNNADLQMIALADSLFLDLCLVKEVFVCSGDKDLDPLIKRLIENDLIVHRVSRQADEMFIVNIQTNQTQKYSISSLPDIPSLQDFIEQLKQIIRQEQIKTQKIWIELARIFQLFADKHGLKSSEVVKYVLPGKKARDIFIEFKDDFVVHKVSANSPTYITLFNDSVTTQITVEDLNNNKINQDLIYQANLKTAVVKIVKTLSEQSQQEYIPIGNVASEFNKQYKLPITKAIKNFQSGSKLTTFLKSCDELKLKQNGTTYQVALK